MQTIDSTNQDVGFWELAGGQNFLSSSDKKAVIPHVLFTRFSWSI
jgi:hypothetical protein